MNKRAAIILISGFLQDRAEPTGTERLWAEMGALSAPDVTIQYCAYNDNWKHMAAFLNRILEADAEVCVCAYSWGCGKGAVQLAGHLRRHGRDIGRMVLCDPVFYSMTLPFRWAAMLDWRKVKIPANVREVHWFRQFEDRPRSQGLKAADPERTTIHNPVVLDKLHVAIDDSREYHALAFEAATRTINAARKATT